MIELALAILTASLPFVIWWLKRRMVKASDPVQQQIEKNETLADQIVRGDADGVNREFDARLRRLQIETITNPSGQGHDQNPKQ